MGKILFANAKISIVLILIDLCELSRLISRIHDNLSGMARKKKIPNESPEQLVIKRYGNRRLYNTETQTYVNYEDLIKLVREGQDIKVIDSTSKEDVTKAVLIQLILEEEKDKKSILPTPFLFQLLRSREESMQDFFTNHLSMSFNAYLKTKEEFDNRFRSMIEMASAAPQMWEKLIPGAEVMKELLLGKQKDDDPEKTKA
jgi:polyhydroxyalkanoate synthesis repressor PhaR